MSDSAGTVIGRDTDPNHSFPYRGPHREPSREAVLRRTRSRISNGQRFDPKKVKPGSSMARRYADIQTELIQAAGPDISPQLKLMVPHIAILKMTIEEQENLLAAREPGFDGDAYGVMVDRLSRMVRTFFKQSRPPGRPRGQRLTAEAHAGAVTRRATIAATAAAIAQAAKRPSLSPAASLSPGNPITIPISEGSP